VTGEDKLLFDTFETLSNITLYIPDDSPNSRFTSDTAPRRVRFAGGVGFGLDPSVGDGIDPLPDPYPPTNQVFSWHWLIFQYESWIVEDFALHAGSCFFWKLPPGITLVYKLS